MKILANGAEVNGAGQELFVIKKSKAADWKIIAYHASSRIENNKKEVDGEWKIARIMNNKPASEQQAH